jgi:uncharacterized protein
VKARELATALAAGVVFAMGLGISGMTDPQKIVGFLDVAGRWDPTLAFVMLGAVGAHVLAAQWALRARKPLLASTFSWATATRIDAPLVVGAALFGLGWGTAGFCPGPAIVDLVAPSASVLVFVASMVGATFVFRLRSHVSLGSGIRQPN